MTRAAGQPAAQEAWRRSVRITAVVKEEMPEPTQLAELRKGVGKRPSLAEGAVNDAAVILSVPRHRCGMTGNQ